MHLPIYRSRSNKVLTGVLGGIAQYFDWNANILRICWVVLTFTPFPGVILYLLLWLLMK